MVYQVAGVQVLDHVAGAHVDCSDDSSGGNSGGRSLLVRFAR